MIKIDKYNKTFENEYLEIVLKKITIDEQKKIMRYIHKDMKITKIADFNELILMDYSKIKEIYCDIVNSKNIYFIKNSKMVTFNKNRKRVYKKDLMKIFCNMVDYYDEVMSELYEPNKSVRLKLIEETGLQVCPYCNRDYINSRGTTTGAQMDHFISKVRFPIFAVSLYNLVPSCSICNRIKNDSDILDYACPFDDDVDWNSVNFTFEYNNDIIEEDIYSININGDKKIEKNITEMKIQEAYQINIKDANRIKNNYLKYKLAYIDEMNNVLELRDEDEVKSKIELMEIIFGGILEDDEIKNIPLGKMKMSLKNDLMDKENLI